MILKSTLRKGQKVTYKKEIMFKGSEQVTAKVVAITNRAVLLDNGDTLHIINA